MSGVRELNRFGDESRFICDRCGASFDSKRRLSGHRSGKHLRRLGLQNAHIDTNLTDGQLGYLAAFLDGEGGIQITKSKRPGREYSLALHPTVYFTNTNEESIRALRSWLSCGCVARRRSLRALNHKDVFVLSITGTRNVLALLTVVRPFLIIKKRQADVMVDYCNSRLSHYRSGDRRFNRTELRLYTQLHRLNLKGGKTQRRHTEV